MDVCARAHAVWQHDRVITRYTPIMKRALLVVSLCIIGGCYTEADVGYGYAGPAPGMVAVGPGVQVIADYDYPVFFSDGAYWRYDGGVWYRSGYYTGGWAVAYDVPV